MTAATEKFDIPMLPTVIAHLMSLSPEDEHFFEKVTLLAEQDPTFAIRILKICNSALLPTVKPIIDLKEAVIRIGVRNIFNLVASIAVTRVFVPTTESEKRLWQHSIQVAALCRMLAKHMPECHIATEKAYLCGLLHDLGLFIRFGNAKEEFNHIDDFEWSTPKEHLDVEKELFGCGHAQLSQQICNQWSVPNPVAVVVGQHHHYQLPKEVINHPQLVQMIRILQIADICSEFCRYDQTFEPKRFFKTIRKITALKQWVKQHRSLFQLIHKVQPTIEKANVLHDELMMT